MTFYPELFREQLVEVLAYRDGFVSADAVVDLLAEPKNVPLAKPILVAEAS